MSGENGSGSHASADATGNFWVRAFSTLQRHRGIALFLFLFLMGAGVIVAPFDWNIGVPRAPVSVDAIPDLGEKQQIVYADWPGRSPQDVEDQISYPLSTALLGVPGVKTVRASSMLGLSSLYVIFEEDVEFYWGRARILEKLQALGAGTLPSGVQPRLGPDATGLGQVFWYKVEASHGGWDLHELRSIQDWTVRLALQGATGVAEVASIGGHVAEYQVEVSPPALVSFQVTLADVAKALQAANQDVGARTLEMNQVEYIVRGVGQIRSRADIENVVIMYRNGVPVRIREVGQVSLGPAYRRGVLDDGGREVVGGVVVARIGENPREVTRAVRAVLSELSSTLPRRTLADGTISQVEVVPFYDRSVLVEQTTGTLSNALFQQLLIVAIVVLIFLRTFRAAFLIALMPPATILATFVAMKLFGVQANVMALAGIAIAIGTAVDMAIVLSENLFEQPRARFAQRAAEVAGPVTISALTTVLSFAPLFFLSAAAGKLFVPLALTKTFAMVCALILVLCALVPLASIILRDHDSSEQETRRGMFFRWGGIALLVIVLAVVWAPLNSWWKDIVFVGVLFALSVGAFWLFVGRYPRILRLGLARRGWVVGFSCGFVGFAVLVWVGLETFTRYLPDSVRNSSMVQYAEKTFPGLGNEFMPPFDEGEFLYMPTTSVSASVSQAKKLLQELDTRIAAIPEVKHAIGKLGRMDSALDPAPVSMFEVMIGIKDEFDAEGVRQWRPHIRSRRQIWDEIVRAGHLRGVTSAPFLQPISARNVMLQTGMRAPVGVQVFAPSLEALESFGKGIEKTLRGVDEIDKQAVFAERQVAKPYLEIFSNKAELARFGISERTVQETLRTAVGGETVTNVIEGRARTGVRLRYAREFRDDVTELEDVFIPTPGGPVPLRSLATIRYRPGPQMIKSENGELTGYVLFDAASGVSLGEAARAAELTIEKALNGQTLERPPGVRYRIVGEYQSQERMKRTLTWVVPVALVIIAGLLLLQFASFRIVLIVMSSVVLCSASGVVLLWLYSRPHFLETFGMGPDLRSIFRVEVINISTAVWVGLIALVGIATDAAVVLAAHLQRKMREPVASGTLLERYVNACTDRVRPCVMTVATTVLALLPVISATGKGGDIMMPMALPCLGGAVCILWTLIWVPVLLQPILIPEVSREDAEHS